MRIDAELVLIDKTHYISSEYRDDGSAQWERKLKALSPVSMSIGLDRTFQRGGFAITIDDTDETFKTMMENETNRKIANCLVSITIYEPDGETDWRTIEAAIVSWDRGDGEFILNCEQNFSGVLPTMPVAGERRITTTDWPNAPKISRGREVLYPMGDCYARRGAVLAWRIDDRPNMKYLLTWSDPAFSSRVQSIQAVYQGGHLVRSTLYSLVRDVNGWEYLLFAGNRARITPFIKVNLKANASLFSAGNPVDSLREGLTELGITLSDDGDGGVDDFKNFCTAHGWSIVGAPNDLKSVLEYIEMWCYNFNCFWRIDESNIIHIRHIDISTHTPDASLSDRHFLELHEGASMEGFANRILAKIEYDYAASSWGSELVVTATQSDYPSPTVEMTEEYAIAKFSNLTGTAAHEKIYYYDRPQQKIVGKMTLDHYRQFNLHLLSIVSIDHSYLQVGASGNYLILREEVDALANEVVIEAFRLHAEV